MNALETAIQKAGGLTKLSNAINTRPNVVNNWRSRGVPADSCPDIEAATGVRCEELRPDVNWAVLRKRRK